MKLYAIGIDVGGTKIAAGVVDREMNILALQISKEHAGQSPAQVVESIHRAYGTVLQQAGIAADEVAGVGLSFAGHVDGRRGVVLTSSNLPQWDQAPLRDIVSRRLSQRVVLDNDTNMGVLAEHHYGAACGIDDVVYVTFSTGVGMGVMLGGKLYQGHTGTAGEIGHTVVEVDGRRCSCGKRGCLMAYGSGIALRNRAWERIQAGEETALRDLAWNDPQLINGELICDIALRGDPVAQDLIISTGRYLGICLSTVVQVLNPEVIVIGGGLTSIGSMLLDPCLESLRQNVHPVLHGSSRILLGRFQQHVGLIGGAAAVFGETDCNTPRSALAFVPQSLESTAPAKAPTTMSAAERKAFEQVEGTIFDIQRYSLEDGPGLRTTVFMKGCPLRCAWCANPESQRMRPELLFFENSCLTCGTCVPICKAGARTIVDDHISWDRQACNRCGDCAQICPAQATVWSGNRAKAGDVLQQVLRDSAFYDGSGGLTLSGGEPLLQPAFSEALLRLAKNEQLHTAIETTGNAPWGNLELLVPYVDLWLFDLKHMDSHAHHLWTGLGNELILSNLRKLASLGASIRVRLPLIPGVNVGEDNLRQTAAFVAQLGSTVQSLDLLPYHKLARAKYDALGQPAKWWDADLLTEEQVHSAAGVLKPYNLTVRIAGEYSTKEISCLP